MQFWRTKMSVPGRWGKINRMFMHNTRLHGGWRAEKQERRENEVWHPILSSGCANASVWHISVLSVNLCFPSPYLCLVLTGLPCSCVCIQSCANDFKAFIFGPGISFLKTDFILFLESREGRDKGRETSMWQRNMGRLPPACTLTGDWNLNPGMCPDLESNHNLTLCRTTLQPIEPHQSGPAHLFPDK